MSTCPNCGHEVSKTDQVCPNCGFNLMKYQKTFFKDAPKLQSRAQYREEFKPKKQNSTVQKMIEWVRVNATIIFVLGVILLIIMSFSRAAGWISFLLLMGWLYIVCDRKEKIEQYTADKRLTQKINQVGSDMFNRIEDHGEKVKRRSEKFEESHPDVTEKVKKVKKKKIRRFGYIPLSIVLTSIINLIVLFTGSGASISNITYTSHLSISRVILNMASRLLFGRNWMTAIILYLIWLLLIVFPIYVIFNTLKNTTQSKTTAFILSLIETVFLIFVVFKLSAPVRASGIFGQITSQFLTYAVSIGASVYFLILINVITTALAGYSLFKKAKRIEQ